MFAGREVGEGGRARRRKRKRDSEPWGSRTVHTDSLPKSSRHAERVLVSQGGLKRIGKTNLFVRIVNRKLINCVAVCAACLPNRASACLVKPKKKYLFKMMIKYHFKSSIHLKLLKLFLNLGEQTWRGEAEVRASMAMWVFLWLICQTSF